MVAYVEGRPVTGTPMMIYTFVNYFTIIEEFKKLKSDIENFTTKRAEDLSQKWLIMWSLFLVAIVIILLISRWYYKLYLK